MYIFKYFCLPIQVMAADTIDEMLGKEITKTDIMNEKFDIIGNVILYEKGFKIKHEGKQTKAPYNYIKELEKTGGAALGKVMVHLTVFDMLGMSYTFDVAIPDQFYSILKRRWEESK